MSADDPRASGVPSPERLLMTKARAAEALDIGITTLDKLIAEGQIPIVHIGRAARVPVAGIREYVERLMEEAS